MIQLPQVQTAVAEKVVRTLSERLEGDISFEKIHFKPFTTLVLKNTLIISPPGCGKTTMLRDLSRILSSGYKIGIADERGEIAASFKGISMHDVGEKTVVMNCVPKAEAMNMMIRSMGIDVVITDEIGSAEDASAILNALYAGVKVIASAHGYSYSDVCLRPDLKKLISSGGFEKFIVLSRRFGPGTVEEVVNYAG